jgi:copper(I)-binding protein
MKRLVPIMAATVALAACDNTPIYDHANRQRDHQDNQYASAAAQGPILQLPVLHDRPGAAYFAIDVPADHGALVGVTSPQAGRIEMHESGMRLVERMTPENGRIVLARGGSHLMLYDVNAQLAAGGTAQLVLRFQGGQTRTLTARVIAAQDAHAGH